MTHDRHLLPRRIFGDDCEECVERASSIHRMVAGLDNSNKRKLGDLALEVHSNPGSEDNPHELGASYADMKAVENLRMAGRLVFASGVLAEVCR